MKTSEEMFREIKDSKELRLEFSWVNDKTAMKAFLQKHGCGASAEEFAEYVRSRTEGELSDNDAENVAGGYPVLFDPAD